MTSKAQSSRPVIFDYEAVSSFIADMLDWRRLHEKDFSIRTQVSQMPGCSPTLVSQVVKGARRLTRDRVEAFSVLLKLTNQETKYLDQWVAQKRRVSSAASSPSRSINRSATRVSAAADVTSLKRPQNHLISHWLNPYVKEACKLADFKPDPETLYRLLGGMASVVQIKRSLEFLIREGFLRRTLQGEVVLNELQSMTSDDLPDKKLQTFHKHALDLAKQGIDRVPVNERRADAFLLTVNDENLAKLRKLLSDCMDQVEQFEQEHPKDSDRLYQVLMHLTPLTPSPSRAVEPAASNVNDVKKRERNHHSRDLH